MATRSADDHLLEIRLSQSQRRCYSSAILIGWTRFVYNIKYAARNKLICKIIINYAQLNIIYNLIKIDQNTEHSLKSV